MKNTELDDALLDLQDALDDFKISPSDATMDDVYRATTAIETACRDRVKAAKE